MFTKKMFGERFRRLRKAKGEAQTAIAQVLGGDCDPNQRYGKWEDHDDAGKAYNHLPALSYVSADYLLGLTDDPAPHGRKEP